MTNLNELFKQFGVTVSAPKADYENLPAWEAIRRAAARDSQKAYAAALEQVKDKLQYGSSTHLIAFAYNFLNDALLSLWEPVKEFANSPVVKEAINEQLNGEGDLVDLLELTAEEKTGKSQKKTAQELRKVFEKLKAPNRLAQELIKYSQETGKSYDEVLNTPEDYLQLIKRAYGSLGEYEKMLHEGFQVWSDLTKNLDQLEKLPLRIILPLLLREKLDLDKDMTLEDDLGIKVNGLCGIIESYSADLALFGKTFIAERCRLSLEELEKYKQIEKGAPTKKSGKAKKNINELLE
ncbi:hypothetical protein HZA97_05340 [Candidatus Woesearchaeota archaeon]|nr:hypothetical protein [Candidatus Woesearchaeota archaeon]